jgi:hypothetical protein
MTRAIVLIVLMLIGSAFDKPADKSAPKPVSRYMRDIGILYLETVEELTYDCGRKSASDSDCMNHWESTMESLEDRVNIALNDKSSQRASGDIPFWDLLKSVKYTRKMLVTIDRNQREGWTKAYATCHSYAHSIALEGNYLGNGGCDDAIEAATRQGEHAARTELRFRSAAWLEDLQSAFQTLGQAR